MKLLLLGLIAFTSISAFASGGKIFNYFGEGYYDGPHCEVSVAKEAYAGGSYVKIRVTNGRDLAIFHSPTFKEKFQETALAKTYSAQTEWEGARRTSIKISRSEYYADIKVVEKIKTFGIWITDREASCNISIHPDITF